MMSAEDLGELLLTLIVTEKCRYCGKILPFGQKVCEDCKRDLSRIIGTKCRFCGAEKTRCICKKRRMKYDGLTSPFYYEGIARNAVLSLKFGEKEYLADTLARDMAECVLTDYKNIRFDYITYVPFGKGQRLERPYNQSLLLAERLSLYLDIPTENALIKIFDTEVQHKLSGIRRAGNVAGVYELSKGVSAKGKTILLVDDIKTTGATLNECSKVLKINGADTVLCVTAALAGVKTADDGNNEEETK